MLTLRAAMFEPSSFNAASGTIQVCFSSGAEVRRRDLEGDYIERLTMTPTAVDLSNLRGASVLDNHNRASIHDVIGVVEDAAITDGRGMATVRLGTRPEIAGIVGDIKSGVIRSLSCGYLVTEWKTSRAADGTRTRTAERWSPMELSFTPVPADPAATTRSDRTEETTTMTLQEQLRSIATVAGVPAAFADDLATRNVPLEEGRTAIIRKAASMIPLIDTRPAHTTRDGGAGLVQRMADGLQARINPAYTPGEGGREFAGASLADLARRCLSNAGQVTFGTGPQLIERAMQTTSDFPALLAETFNKQLLQLQTAPSLITQVFRKATGADFRARHVIEISDGTGLEKVNEAGEIKFGVLKESEKASYAIASYARMYSLSFQAMTNDDIGALSDISSRIVRGARGWFDGFLVSAILANPVMADGKALFHADHGNLAGTGGPPADDSIAEGKLAMRLQTDLSGTPVNATPRYIVIPAGLENDVDKLLASLYPMQPAEAAPAARTLTPVVEPRLDATDALGWYLFADPALAPALEYAELQGYQGPQVETRQGWSTLGAEFRIVWHVGAGPIDSRGAWKNPGA